MWEIFSNFCGQKSWTLTNPQSKIIYWFFPPGQKIFSSKRIVVLCRDLHFTNKGKGNEKEARWRFWNIEANKRKLKENIYMPTYIRVGNKGSSGFRSNFICRHRVKKCMSKTILHKHWYFVTEIVLTYWEKKMF